VELGEDVERHRAEVLTQAVASPRTCHSRGRTEGLGIPLGIGTTASSEELGQSQPLCFFCFLMRR